MFQTSIVATLIAVAAALTTRVRAYRIILWSGAIILVGVWAPLLSASTGWAGDNPVGLGLLAVFGTPVGLLVVGCGLVLRLIEFLGSW